MIKRAGFLLTGVLHGALIWGAASGDYSDPLRFVLERLVNPKQEIMGGGGTHNLIHYACIDDERAVAGFLESSSDVQLEQVIQTHLSDDKAKPAHTFSVGKGRFALFHSAGARHLVLREYAKGTVQKFEDTEIQVNGLQDPAYGECPIVLSIGHGALFRCWTVQAGVSKTLHVNPPRVGWTTAHTPPENNKRLGFSYLSSQVPSYPAPMSPEYQASSSTQSSSNGYQDQEK